MKLLKDYYVNTAINKGDYMKERNFAVAARTLRKQRNLTIDEVAERLKMTRNIVRNIECGRKKITDEIIKAYMDCFDFEDERALIKST